LFREKKKKKPNPTMEATESASEEEEERFLGKNSRNDRCEVLGRWFDGGMWNGGCEEAIADLPAFIADGRINA
jgi:hypothetical protein